MAIFKLVAFFMMFAAVIAVAATVSTMVTGVMNIGMKKMHGMHMGKKMMGKMHGMKHGMHMSECRRTEVPIEEAEGERKC